MTAVTAPPSPLAERIQTTAPPPAVRIPGQPPNPQPNLFQGLLTTLGHVVGGAVKLGKAAVPIVQSLVPLVQTGLQVGVPLIANAIAGGMRRRGRGGPWAEGE